MAPQRFPFPLASPSAVYPAGCMMLALIIPHPRPGVNRRCPVLSCAPRRFMVQYEINTGYAKNMGPEQFSRSAPLFLSGQEKISPLAGKEEYPAEYRRKKYMSDLKPCCSESVPFHECSRPDHSGRLHFIHVLKGFCFRKSPDFTPPRFRGTPGLSRRAPSDGADRGCQCTAYPFLFTGTHIALW